MDAIELDFGRTIRKYREKSGLSQEDFAAEAGIHRTYISSIELGKVRVSIAIAGKLADTLGVPLSKIFREIERTRDQAG